MFKLYLIRNDHQSNFCISILCHTVDQFEHARIVALLEVDHRILPKRVTTEFECKSRLANTRTPLDMQMIDISRGESEIDTSFRQVRLHFLGCLIRHLVFTALDPLIKRQQPRRTPCPMGCNGRMLIAPLGDIFATVDLYSLCNFRG